MGWIVETKLVGDSENRIMTTLYSFKEAVRYLFILLEVHVYVTLALPNQIEYLILLRVLIVCGSISSKTFITVKN